MRKKIVVGMSGGVDSSMALLLLKRQGWDPVGVSLKLARWESPENELCENVCCTEESFSIAREVCKRLEVPYHIYDVKEDFKREVMDYFVDELKSNRTPNPCIICNRNLKFKKLFEFAKKKDIEYVATGHYARIKFNEKTKKYELMKAKDEMKDQTYGLCLFDQEYLSHIILPLGDYTKEEVYQLAKKEHFDFFLKTKQSQDLCFVSGKALQKFIKEKLGEKKGDMVDEGGRKIGTHKGLYFYTLGQRKGLNTPGTYFVKAYDIKNNRLIVTKRREEMHSQNDIMLKPYNFISGENPKSKISVNARIRYGESLVGKAMIYPPENGILKICFDEARYAVTPGQFCVFYDSEVCLGGGIIN